MMDCNNLSLFVGVVFFILFCVIGGFCGWLLAPVKQNNAKVIRIDNDFLKKIHSCLKEMDEN